MAPELSRWRTRKTAFYVIGLTAAMGPAVFPGGGSGGSVRFPGDGYDRKGAKGYAREHGSGARPGRV